MFHLIEESDRLILGSNAEAQQAMRECWYVKQVFEFDSVYDTIVILNSPFDCSFSFYWCSFSRWAIDAVIVTRVKRSN
jgi:hypothetical protein